MVSAVTDRSPKDTIRLHVHQHVATLNASLFEVLSSDNALVEQRDSIIQVLEELLKDLGEKGLNWMGWPKQRKHRMPYWTIEQLFS